jgi:dihydrofolate reductase
MKNDRPKVSAYIATSLDGYIAREDGDIDWLIKFNSAGEDYGFTEFFRSVDAMIIGRKTYEKAMTFQDWSYAGKRVIVMSESLQSVCSYTELYKGEILPLLAQLKSEGVKHIYVDGGTTISKFLSSSLVDRMIISIIPTVLGSGIPLFQPIKSQISCKLTSVKAYPTGLVQLHYEMNS